MEKNEKSKSVAKVRTIIERERYGYGDTDSSMPDLDCREFKDMWKTRYPQYLENGGMIIY